MFLYILGITSLCMKFFLSCSAHVCLTWEAKNETITFKCKVSQLRFTVHFLNPKNEEQGFCISPIPVPRCFSSHNVISQDLQTNTTVLVIKRNVDSRLNGPWKCSHGRNLEAAIVNVTVLQRETFKIIFKNENCGEQHVAWTFNGVLIGALVVFILGRVSKKRQWNIDCRRKIWWCESCCVCRTKCYYVTQLFTCILLMCLTISIAYASGLQGGKCKDKELFIIYGVCIVFTFVICLSIPRKDFTEQKYLKAEMMDIAEMSLMLES